MRTLVAVVLTGSVLAACGPTIRIARNADLPIAAGARYAWGRADGPPSIAEVDPRANDPSVRAQIEASLDRQLLAKGFQRTTSDSAELLVHFHLGVLTRTDTLRTDADACESPPCSRYQWGYWGRPEQSVGREITYDEGSLMFDVMDRQRGLLLWRGLAEGDATPSSTPAARQRRIDKAIARLLRDFPGGS
jgi:hypothetical protein